MRCGKLATEKIRQILEVAHVRLPHHLASPNLVNLIGVRADANVIILCAKTSARTARCPVCGKRSGRIHSQYMRMLADLSWQGVPVTVHLHIRRFFCDQEPCNRVIFAERSPSITAHYARRTERLDGWFTHVSFALGGEAGSRLLKDLEVVVSGETLLRASFKTAVRCYGRSYGKGTGDR